MNFQSLPCKYKSMINSINDFDLKKIYSQFEYIYLSTDQIHQDWNVINIKETLLDLFKDYKLIIYNFKERISENSQNVIICIEKKCLIIEGIDAKLIEQILIETNSLLINVNETQINEEIECFCNHFLKNNENSFVQYTIHPIAGYLIRRFFYPTSYFQDPTFFNFKNKKIDSFESKFAFKFNKLLSTKAVNDVDSIMIEELFKDENNTKNDGIEICNFTENEFIKLRIVYCNDSLYYLVIHIDTLHVFLMKKFANYNLSLEQQREIYFCQNFSHRCFTPFYGFVKRNENIIGIIYEYMSNNSLTSYLEKTNTKEIDEMFSFMTMIRISQGINYLHSNSLIHRDLKPMNILVNHDNIAYISDFETIREINEQQFQHDEYSQTNDIGSSNYTSPEQYYGEKYSYPTDVYSFGLIVYFLFMHQDQKNLQIFEQNESIIKMQNCPKIAEQIYESCVKYNQNERLTIKQVNDLLYDEIKSFNDLNRFIKEVQNENKINSTIQYIYENICFLKQYDTLHEIKEYFFKSYAILISHLIQIDEYKSDTFNNMGNIYFYGFGTEQSYFKAKQMYELSCNLNNSWGLYNIGYLYCNGHGVERSYSKAMEYYQLSAKQKNPSAITGIGFLYKNAKGVDRDYQKAKQCFEFASKYNNSNALYHLGHLYFNGYGVEKDIFKAKKYFELASELNNSFGLNALGFMYENCKEIGIDYLKSKEYYEKAIELNNTNSLVNLALLYRDGYGVPRDYLKAKELLEKAAKKIMMAHF